MSVKIVRQYETKLGDIFSQWTDGSVTIHLESDRLGDELDVIATMPYIKETDFVEYPQRIKFHCIIARHYRVNYNVALFEGLIPPLPKPVYKAIQPVRRGKAGKRLDDNVNE